jgi:hypothetical protein
MKLKILKKTQKDFQGEDGQKREYFWYVAERENGTAIRFGSVNGTYNVDDTPDLILEEYEQSNGKKGYKELAL